MLSEKMLAELNEQINAELYSAYLYLSMSAWFEEENLPGFAAWMRVQAQEETAHAMRFFGYVTERGGRVKLGAIEQPPADWESTLSAFENVLEHEQKVTSLIHKLVELARGENDYATDAMLQWFVNEQVEEEASADEILQKLRRLKDSPQGLFMLDSKLAERKAEGDEGE
ncbi:MAG: ferritin [Phycisphaerae bacterium]